MQEAPTAPPRPPGERSLYEYDSLAHVLAEAQQPKVNRGSSDSQRDTSWDHGLGMEGAIAALGGVGSPELAEQVRGIMVDMVPHIPAVPDVGSAWDVCGSVVDVGRFLTGEPECMLDFYNPQGTQRILDVYVSMAISAGVSAAKIVERGAAVCAMIDATERSGVRVRLHWCTTERMVYGGGVPESTSWGLIKDYHAPLDLDLVAFILAHPAMLRRIIFRLWERQPDMAQMCGCGYGEPVATQVPAGAVFIPEMNYGYMHKWDNPLVTVRAAFDAALEGK